MVLASASPRRQELLAQLVEAYEVVPARLDEDALTDPDPLTTARVLAREKALAVSAARPDALVIGGDTVVALPEEGAWRQLAKPADPQDAERMLSELAGRTHVVATGICLVGPGVFSSFVEQSKVTFRRLTSEEISRYVATGEPMDKAGAYGLQGDARDFVERVEGSVTNVIGLPVEALREALQSLLKR